MRLMNHPALEPVLRLVAGVCWLVAAAFLAQAIFGSPDKQPAFRFPGPITVHLTHPLEPGECITQDVPKPAYAVTVCMLPEKDAGR